MRYYFRKKSSPKIIQVFSGDSFKKERNDNLIEYNLYDRENFVVRLVYYRN